MGTETDLRNAYPNLVRDIKPRIDGLDEVKKPSKRIDLSDRVIKASRQEDGKEPELSLEIADLVEQVQESKFYHLLVEYVKDKGYFTHNPFFMIDMDDGPKINHIKNCGDSVLSLGVYTLIDGKTVDASESISIMKKENDKIKLLDLSEIMKQVK